MAPIVSSRSLTGGSTNTTRLAWFYRQGLGVETAVAPAERQQNILIRLTDTRGVADTPRAKLATSSESVESAGR